MINTRLVGEAGEVGVVEIDRPERRNALDVDHCRALADAVEKVVAGGARVLVLTGAGTSFCAGADLGGVYGDTFRDAINRTLTTIVGVQVPVVAAVNGPAIGAGTQLAIACDLRVAVDGAVFGVPTARIGLAVDPWTISRLAAVAGGGTARALLLGGDTVTAEVAHARGLVDRIGDLDAALAWALEIATFAPLTLAYSKRAANAAVAMGTAVTAAAGSAASGDDLAAAYDAVWSSDDAAEGARARAERRPPRFQGR
jgi:enoyl-CoA hydratase